MIPFESYFPYETYNPHQKEFLEEIAKNIDFPECIAMTLSAPTGSGKTSVIEPLIAYALQHQKVIIPVMRTVSQLTIFQHELELVQQKIASYGGKNPDVKPFNFINIPGKANVCNNPECMMHKKDIYQDCKLKCGQTKRLIQDFVTTKGAEPDNLFKNFEEYKQFNDIKREEFEKEQEEERKKNPDKKDKKEYNYLGTYPRCPQYFNTYIDEELVDNRLLCKDRKIYNENALAAVDKIINRQLTVDELKEIAGGKFCPYELIMLAAARCQVIIMNINHVMQLGIRRAIYEKLNLSSSDVILIFDETHNVPNLVTEMHSSTLKPSNFLYARKTLYEMANDSKYANVSVDIPDVITKLRYEYNVPFSSKDIPKELRTSKIKDGAESSEEFTEIAPYIMPAHDTVYRLLNYLNNVVVRGNFESNENEISQKYNVFKSVITKSGTKQPYNINNLSDSEFKEYMSAKISKMFQNEIGGEVTYTNVIKYLENLNELVSTGKETVNVNDFPEYFKFFTTIKGRLYSLAVILEFMEQHNYDSASIGNISKILKMLALFSLKPSPRTDALGSRDVSSVVSVYTYSGKSFLKLKNNDDKTLMVSNLFNINQVNPKTSKNVSITRDFEWSISTKNVDPSSYICEAVNNHHFSLFMSGTIEPLDLHNKLFFGGNLGIPNGENSKLRTYSVPSNFKPENREVFLLNDLTTIGSMDMCVKYQNEVYNYGDLRKIYINKIIDKLCSEIDGNNTMVAFPSYSLMYEFLTNWSQSRKLVLQSDKLYLNGIRLFVEFSTGTNDIRKKIDPNSNEYESYGIKRGMYYDLCKCMDSGNNTVEEFMDLPNHNECGLIFSVQRGKYSEGIDFRGDSLKRIFVIGFPLAAYDTMQRAVNNYYNTIYGKDDGSYIAYSLPAQDGMLQTAGRVLRSVNDTGTIIYGDFRILKTDSYIDTFKSKKFSSIGKYMPNGFFDNTKTVTCEELLNTKFKY